MATTIKVSEELRDRINRQARAEGLSAAAYIEKVLESHQRMLRLESFATAINSAPEDYWQEVEAWESLEAE